MKKALLLLLIPCLSFAQWDKNTTPTYTELIDIYRKLDATHTEIQLFQMGESDTHLPIYLCVINGGKDSVSTFQQFDNNNTILINNAIHAGEPDGVNACLLWIERWIANGKPTANLPVIGIIPAYNVGGMLNRNATSRANQDGPAEYGFRGNAQNLDLNRDFIKMDSKNAHTFARIYSLMNPDIFVDTHVSNGADYQYTLTLITSLKERLAPSIRKLTYDNYLPKMTVDLKSKNLDWAPYVETKGETPETGIIAFDDLPRYAMGYASLFHSMSFTVETHMLKPFPERVQATLLFLSQLIDWSGKNKDIITKSREEAIGWFNNQTSYRFQYETADRCDSILFKGFEHGFKASEVSGLPRLFYDRSKPFEKRIPYYNIHFATDSVQIPEGYIVDLSAAPVIQRLQENGVVMYPMKSGEAVVFSQRIRTFESGKQPYEGHFIHRKIKSFEQKDTISILPGSVYVPMNQAKRQFIVSVLEPRCPDSYFAWNLLDSYVQEKEYFSAYVFEDLAIEILKSDSVLAQEFYSKKKTDLQFASDGAAQLFFIYQRSLLFEGRTFNRLPVFKVY